MLASVLSTMPSLTVGLPIRDFRSCQKPARQQGLTLKTQNLKANHA